MYWQEDDKKDEFVVPDDIVDVAFRFKCLAIPNGHAYSLSCALHDALPWIADEENIGIHQIHVAETGNGWMRPESDDDLLYPSKRTSLSLRVTKERVEDVMELSGKTLDIAGYELTVGKATVKPLLAHSTLFSRYVESFADETEDEFLDRMHGILKQMRIPVKKMMSGKDHEFSTSDGKIFSKSLMLADLGKEDSVYLQQEGIGGHRKLGLGLFLPHKGLKAVKQDDD